MLAAQGLIDVVMISSRLVVAIIGRPPRHEAHRPGIELFQKVKSGPTDFQSVKKGFETFDLKLSQMRMRSTVQPTGERAWA